MTKSLVLLASVFVHGLFWCLCSALPLFFPLALFLAVTFLSFMNEYSFSKKQKKITDGGDFFSFFEPLITSPLLTSTQKVHCFFLFNWVLTWRYISGGVNIRTEFKLIEK